MFAVPFGDGRIDVGGHVVDIVAVLNDIPLHVDDEQCRSRPVGQGVILAIGWFRFIAQSSRRGGSAASTFLINLTPSKYQ